MANRRILLSSDFFAPHVGGTEHVVEDLGLQLLAKGFSVDVLTRTLKERSENTHRGMSIFDLEADGSPLFSNLRGDLARARSILAEGGYDAAIFFGDPITWNLWVTLNVRVPGTRIILVPGINEDGYRLWGSSAPARKLIGELLRGADQVISITKEGADARFYKEEGIPYLHIPNAVAPALAQSGFRKRHGLDDKPLLLCVGNLYPVKNQARLLELFARAPGQWQLALAGHPSEADKAYGESVARLAAADPRVHLLGGLTREEVGAAMHEADLLLMPSIAEIAPLTLLEAMSAGLPWIATHEVGSAKELVGGMQASVEEFPALAQRLLADEATRSKLGAEGRERWEKSFGWEAILPRYLALLGDAPALDHKPASPLGSGIAKVAIITRTKNRTALLKRAVESVLAQKLGDWVHVIVNDGGDPQEVEKAIAPYRDRYANRLTVIHHARSLGMEAASNAGIRASASEHIALLDDDDRWHPDFLLETIGFMEQANPSSNYGGVGCWTVTVFEDASENGQLRMLKQEDWNAWLQSVSLFQMSARNTLTNNSFLFRRSICEELHGFNEELPVLGDWDFNLRFLQRANIGLLHKRLAYYHQRPRAQGGVYGNTVIAGLKDHIEFDTLLRNQLLRADVDGGRFGMGAVLHLARQLDELAKAVRPVEELNRRQAALERQMASLEANLRTLAQATQLVLKALNVGTEGKPPKP